MAPSRTLFYVHALGFVLVFWSMQGASAAPLAPITVVIFSVLIVLSVVAQVSQASSQRNESSDRNQAKSSLNGARFCSSCGAETGGWNILPKLWALSLGDYVCFCVQVKNASSEEILVLTTTQRRALPQLKGSNEFHSVPTPARASENSFRLRLK